MRRASGKLLPRASPFAAWAAFVRRAVDRLGGAKVAVIPTEDAPPAKPRRRKPNPAAKVRRRVKR